MKSALKKYIIITASIWTACCALLLGFYLLLMMPQQKTIGQIKEKIAQKQEIVQRLQKAATPQAQARLKEELQNQQEKLYDFMINLDDASKLTFHVSEIARGIPHIEASSFASKRLTDGPGAEIENCEHVMEQRINVNFKSNFPGFARFLNLMERNRPVVFVDKFKIERERSSPLEIIDMELAVFVKTPPRQENAGAPK
ncbi:MAG: hypothetical protein AMJ79_02195 [Phycisphaerae bacterium SM23_30]|nr:MAG: hypothetical protein AMJ79_02195 [Phycisphaerae bacterium SM23_30]